MSIRAHLLAALCMLGPVVTVEAAPALWEVRDDDSALWFFGSFHVLPADTEWRTPLLEATLAGADRVVLETDITPLAAAELGAQAIVRGIYADGTRLTDGMDPALEAQMRTALAELGMPVGPVLAMRPWMAANTISVAALVAQGFVAEGVELALLPDLEPERLVFLETGAEQIAVLAGGPEDEQMALLAATLSQMDGLSKSMDKSLGYWLSGEPERLLRLFAVDMGGQEAAFMARLLDQRNRAWLEPLEQMLADNEQNLVVVGAAHLVGDGSVLALLEEAGYTVQRIQ